MKSGAENIGRAKMPYSTPRLISYSPGSLAATVRKKSAAAGRSVESRLSLPGTPPPPLIVEGFESDIGSLAQVLSSLGWRSRRRPEPATEPLETIPEKGAGPAEEGICILLVDMRHRFSGPRQPLTRMDMDSDSSATLTLILTDSGEDFTSGGEIPEQIDGISRARSPRMASAS